MTPAEWLIYENQGATRNQPLAPELVQALSFLPELGLSMKVFSGGQPGIGETGARVGSTRHDHGGAADVFFYRGGERLDWANPEHVPIFQEVVRRAKAAGVTGFGAGDGYMQPGSMHLGFGDPAVWGAGGKGDNAPDWLRAAYGVPSQPLSYGPNTPAATPQNTGVLPLDMGTETSTESKWSGLLDAAIELTKAQQPQAPQLMPIQRQAYQPVKRDPMAVYSQFFKTLG